MRSHRRGNILRRGIWLLAAASVLGSGSIAVAAEEATKRTPSIWEQETFSGDWRGLRTALSDDGVDLTLQYIGEGFSVLSGGIHDRGSYEGRLEFSIDTDLEKFMSWRGASTHVTFFNIHDGGSNVADNVGSIADPSNIDGLRTTRLFNVWFEQNFFSTIGCQFVSVSSASIFTTSQAKEAAG